MQTVVNWRVSGSSACRAFPFNMYAWSQKKIPEGSEQHSTKHKADILTTENAWRDGAAVVYLL